MSSSMPKVSPTESFLRYLTLPEDESEFVELQHCAVVLVSHLDRLAAPYLPVSSNQKVQSCTHLHVHCINHRHLISSHFSTPRIHPAESCPIM